MKKITILALSIANFFAASSVYAVEGGTPLSWVEHPYLVESRCTGTVLAGKYVMLAGHCSLGDLRAVNLSNGTRIQPIHRNTLYKPELPKSEYADIALWTLSEIAPMNKIAFIDDLNNAVHTPQLNDKVTIMGFGQNNKVPRLGEITNFITSTLYPEIFIYKNEAQKTTNGDSGAPVFSAENKIIATHYSAGGQGVNLRFVKNWLLSGINDWHSPTELKFTGTKTIEIQSLHVNNTNLALRQNNGSLSSGDVTVTGGSCITDGDVAPFGICTLEMKSGPYEGKVVLDDGNEITINRGKKPTPPNPDPDGKSKGGGGGSLGWLTLLALLPLAWRRK